MNTDSGHFIHSVVDMPDGSTDFILTFKGFDIVHKEAIKNGLSDKDMFLSMLNVHAPEGSDLRIIESGPV